MKHYTFAILIFVLAGCASQPDNLQATYVSPGTYAKYDCDQLILETNNINRRLSELYASLKKKADNDAVQMGLGLVLFWPVLFALEGGDGPESATYSRLKGEHEAIQQASIYKKCDLNAIPEFKTPEQFKQEQQTETAPQPAPQKEKSRVIICSENQTCIIE